MASRERWTAPREGVLVELEALVERYRQSDPSVSGGCADPGSLGSKAQAIYRARRERDRLFAEHGALFADPAWDLLLDLFIAREVNKPTAISSACIAANVPATTALRWLALLEQKGLIERDCDPNDSRRSFVRLSDTAHMMMETWLRSWAG